MLPDSSPFIHSLFLDLLQNQELPVFLARSSASLLAYAKVRTLSVSASCTITGYATALCKTIQLPISFSLFTIASFYVRKQAKSHGAKKRIEGRPQSPVAIVDDVITSGGSAVEALNAVKSEGYDSKCLLSIVYRGGDEQKAKISEHGKFLYIFDEKYFVDTDILKNTHNFSNIQHLDVFQSLEDIHLSSQNTLADMCHLQTLPSICLLVLREYIFLYV